jgi:hypothetical protein
MPMRDFTDSKGVHWIVWSTKPWTGGVLAALRGGWLTFVSPQSRRRLIGIPDDWESLNDKELEGLCRKAEPVKSSPTPPGGEETLRG